jgi:ribonucleoside-diphosphate reductase alpha chain
VTATKANGASNGAKSESRTGGAISNSGSGGSPVANAGGTSIDASVSVLSAHLQTMMGDAPMCSGCGHTTVRNGACYKCLNCGNSMGCS